MNLKKCKKKDNYFDIKFKNLEENFSHTKFYKTYMLDKNINYKSFFWFSFGCLILYPIILGFLLWLVVEKKSIIQIILSLLGNWEKSLNLDMQHYIELIKSIYSVCLVIYLAVSVVWVEFETSKIIDNDIKLKIKKFMLSICLLSSVLILWGRYDPFSKVINYLHIVYPMTKSQLDIFLFVEQISYPKLYLPLLGFLLFNKVFFAIINLILLYFFNFKFKILLLLFLMMVFYETFSSVVTWLTSEGEEIQYRYHIEFLILSFLSIFFAFFENGASLLGIIPVLICLVIATLKECFNKTLLMNSLIIFIGYSMSLALSSSKSIKIMFQIFNASVISLYICVWFISKVKILKYMNSEEKDAVNGIAKEAFGGGIMGAIVFFILTLLRNML